MFVVYIFKMNEPIKTMERLSLFNKSLLLVLLLSLGACATTNPNGEPNIDPFENVNRAVFGFNDGIDRILLKPIAKGYRYITPNFVRLGVSNFFSNLSEVGSLVNATLQGKPVEGAKHTGRFLINSTIGIGGLFDVAKTMNLEKMDGEDFGQTLAVWGFNSGYYIVLPLLGSSTIRDGAGIPVNMALDPLGYYPEHRQTQTALNALEIIDLRTRLLRAEEFIRGDRYLFIRDAYLQRREFLVNDGTVVDDFGGDGELDF